MKAGFSSKSDNASAYIEKSYRGKDGKPTTKVIKRLGTLKEIKERCGCEDPRQWVRDYAKRLTEEEKGSGGYNEVKVSNGHLSGNGRVKLKAGDLFLLPLYHALGLDKIFESDQKMAPDGATVDAVMRMLTMVKVLAPHPDINPWQWAESNMIKNIFSRQETLEALLALGKMLDSSEPNPKGIWDVQGKIYHNSLSLGDRPRKFTYYECNVDLSPVRLKDICGFESDLLEVYQEVKDGSTGQLGIGVLVDSDGIPVAYIPFGYQQDRHITMDELVEVLASKFGLDKETITINPKEDSEGGTDDRQTVDIKMEIDWFFRNIPDYILNLELKGFERKLELHCLISFISLTLVKLLQRLLCIEGLSLEELVDGLREIEYYYNEKAGYIALFEMNQLTNRLEQIYPKIPFAYHLVTHGQMNKMYRYKEINGISGETSSNTAPD